MTRNQVVTITCFEAFLLFAYVILKGDIYHY